VPAVPGEDVTIIGDWDSHIVKARRRASGKERTTLEIKSDLTIADLDPVRLGAAVAQALAAAISMGIRNNTGVVSERTEDARRSAESSWAGRTKTSKKTGKTSVSGSSRLVRGVKASKNALRDRYSGGKIGPMKPFQYGRQLLMDSGRLAKSIVARLVRGGQDDNEGKWTINTAANRLTQDQPLFRKRMLDLLAPIIAAATTAQSVQQAIVNAGKNAVQVAGKKSLQELLRATLEAGRTARELGGELEQFSDEQEQ
jgi:hypothetical protein